MKRNPNIFLVALFMLINWSMLSAQAQCAECVNIPPAYDECTPPTGGYDRVVTVTGNQTWNSLLAGISHEDMKQRIRIIGTGTLRVVNGNLKLSDANSLIVVEGPELIINNGNLIFEKGSVGTFRNVRLRTSGNIQQSEGSTLCITNSEVEVGDEQAGGRFNTTGNQYTSANFQNDKGRRYLNTVCMNVTHDYQLQSGGGEDILINVCAEIGDQGGTHARTGVLDGQDSGNFQNSSNMQIYNSRFWVIENVQNQSSGTLLTCDVSFRTTNGNFQNDGGDLSGCELCVWVDSKHRMQNDGNWTATFNKRRASTQGSYPNLPPNSSAADIASCFVICCEGGNPFGSLGNFVWNDINRNGIQDSGETGVPNVRVQLKNCNNAVLATTTTNANGIYNFPNLQPGCYRIGVIVPTGFRATIANQGTNDALDSDIIPATAMSGDIDLDISENDPTNDVGIFQVGSIGDFTFCDNNNNGVFDNGDTPQSGVLVTLCDANNVTIATRTTDAQGRYLFPNLAAATYIVKFPTTIAGGKTITTPTPITVPLGPGQNFLNADGGYRPLLGCIGDQVYCDNNGNNIYDNGDTPVTGITVTLCDAGGTTITSQAVGGNGQYIFNNLAAGFYIVKFPDTTPDGKRITTPNPLAVNLGPEQKFLDADGGYRKPDPNCDEPRNNSISKSCTNGTLTLTGTALAGYEYQWLKSTSVCPSDPSQAIPGATGQNYTLPGVVYQTTYFTRCARPIGCTTWGDITESNCIIVTPSDCNTQSPCLNVSVDGNTNGTLTVSSLGSYTSLVQVINSLGQAVSNALYTQPSVTIPVKAGTYSVKVQLYSASNGLKFECEKVIKPVTVLGSSILPLQGQNILLNMSVFNEPTRIRIEWLNNTGDAADFFTVQKWNKASGSFEKLETLNAKATDKIEHYFSYDSEPADGDNIYRIQMSTSDGNKRFSNEQTIKFVKSYDFKIFPNPSSDYVDIDLKQYAGKSVTIQVYNGFGKMILLQALENTSTIPYHLNLGAQSNGQYLIRVTAQGRKDVIQKFIVQN
jgi:hypothetical protein